MMTYSFWVSAMRSPVSIALKPRRTALTTNAVVRSFFLHADERLVSTHQPCSVAVLCPYHAVPYMMFFAAMMVARRSWTDAAC